MNKKSPIFLEFLIFMSVIFLVLFYVAYFFTFHWRRIFQLEATIFLTSNVDYSDLYRMEVETIKLIHKKMQFNFD